MKNNENNFCWLHLVLITFVWTFLLIPNVVFAQHHNIGEDSKINYAAMLKEKDIPFFIKKMETFKKDNPSASEELLNEFIKKEMRKKYEFDMRDDVDL